MGEELLFDGKTYISSKLAAERTGYAKDYIGQLCRGGKVDARLIGRSWYVEERSLTQHKTRSATDGNPVSITKVVAAREETPDGDASSAGGGTGDLASVPQRLTVRTDKVESEEASGDDGVARGEKTIEPDRPVVGSSVQESAQAPNDAASPKRDVPAERGIERARAIDAVADPLKALPADGGRRREPTGAEDASKEAGRSAESAQARRTDRHSAETPASAGVGDATPTRTRDSAPSVRTRERTSRQQALLAHMDVRYESGEPIFYADDAPLFPGVPAKKRPARPGEMSRRPLNLPQLDGDLNEIVPRKKRAAAVRRSQPGQSSSWRVARRAVGVALLLVAFSSAVGVFFLERSGRISLSGPSMPAGIFEGFSIEQRGVEVDR